MVKMEISIDAGVLRPSLVTNHEIQNTILCFYFNTVKRLHWEMEYFPLYLFSAWQTTVKKVKEKDSNNE